MKMLMDNTTHATTYLKNYTVTEYTITDVQLDVNITEEATTVIAVLTCHKNPQVTTNTGQLVLNGENLQLQQVLLDGKQLANTEYTLTAETLTLRNLPASFTVQTTVIIKPQENTALSGLYKANKIFCTQCEAEGFRRITYYLDRPDVMAKFMVTIHADKRLYPVLLANGNLIAHGSESDARHYATWQDPFKKPAYLFAMVAADLVALYDTYVTMSGRLVSLQLYVERENIDQTAHAMAALKKAMAWDELAYGREYDLDIYMIVAVNDFNMGAMENKGLNIFNSRYILVSPTTATDQDYAGVDMVVGHEYFHNWSGNRVTCRDWFQLSLKEGFTVFREQQFTQYITKSIMNRIGDVKLLLTHQFAEDSGPLAHPVRPDAYVEINNFYTTTIYEKGAEVIRMLHTLLGADKFRAGTDLYFARYDGQAVTTDDFVAAMQEVAGIDLTQFKLWYTQAGTPEVSVTEQYDEAAQKYTLNLQQFIPDTPGQTNKLPMHIPIGIGLLDENGNDMPIGTTVISLVDKQQQYVFNNIKTKPHLSILRGFSAPVKLKYVVSDNDLAFLLQKDNDDFNRWYAAQDLYSNVLIDLTRRVISGAKLELPNFIVETFAEILLSKDLDLALKTELLILPSMSLLIDKMQPAADPLAIYTAKKFVISTFATKLDKELLAMYDAYTVFGSYKYNPENMARRSCRNTILHYIASTKSRAAVSLVMEQYNKANNMTDTIAALTELASINCNERIEALIDFYNDWLNNPLVINKWFAIQALADSENVLDQVKALLKHKAFDMKNPNSVRALIGSFCSGNIVNFHAVNGDGYKFLADMVLELDAINPQVAARILTPLTQWRKFSVGSQEMMRTQLQRIQKSRQLSADVSEIINKSL